MSNKKNNVVSWLSVNRTIIYKILIVLAIVAVTGYGGRMLYKYFTPAVEYPTDVIALLNQLQDKARKDSTAFADSLASNTKLLLRQQQDLKVWQEHVVIQEQKTQLYLTKLKLEYEKQKLHNANTDYDGAILISRRNLAGKSGN